MIGYLKPLRPTNPQRRTFRGIQCGLCHEIGRIYGLPYRIFAGPDLVFANHFADLAAQDQGEERPRPCVVVPRPLQHLPPTRTISNLPSRAPTDRTRLVAAFGIYMGIEKVRDDWEDEGGWHKWALWQVLRPGWIRARQALVDAGFPVDLVEAQMTTQRALEARPSASLDEASAPTRRIGAAFFGFFHPRGAAIGDAIGRFLFALDNLLDYPKDQRAGEYNAIPQLGWAPRGQTLLPRDARDRMLAEARGAIDALDDALSDFPDDGYVRRAVVDGFRDKVRRYERLSDEARARATLAAVCPPREGVFTVFRRTLERLTTTAWARTRFAASLVALQFFPNTALASRWWPDDVELDTALIPDTAVTDTADTGSPIQDTDPAFGDDPADTPCETFDELCWHPCMNNCGFTERGCGEGCEDGCDAVCNDACGDACGCNETCGDACDSA